MKLLLCGLIALIVMMLSGCDAANRPTDPVASNAVPEIMAGAMDSSAPADEIKEISQITTLESGFSSASFSGDDGFETFLAQDGASSDADVTQFLVSKLLADVSVNSNAFGCSTLTVSSPDGHQLFGRNFDWQSCDALVVTSKPSQGYASISTVNLGFISQAGGGLGQMLRQNDVRVLAALYAPLDGMNEKGLAVSVNMIQDNASINQNTDKPDLTTTTAVRLLLNKAVNVDEALTLLQQYDLHASMGMMIHFALADTTGRGVVVEYINNEMVVTETPVVTNFYLAEGNKHGNQSGQSILMVTHDVRAALRGNRILYLEDGKILDELNLPGYEAGQAREREIQLGSWLSALQW